MTAVISLWQTSRRSSANAHVPGSFLLSHFVMSSKRSSCAICEEIKFSEGRRGIWQSGLNFLWEVYTFFLFFPDSPDKHARAWLEFQICSLVGMLCARLSVLAEVKQRLGSSFSVFCQVSVPVIQLGNVARVLGC